jgi:hypothetical protein
VVSVVLIDVGDLKMARETLAIAHRAIMDLERWDVNTNNHLSRIEKMMDQIYVMRPLGPDGKHGDNHTQRCGCEVVVEWFDIPDFPDYQLSPSIGAVRRKKNGHILTESDNGQGCTYFNVWRNGKKYSRSWSTLCDNIWPEFKPKAEWEQLTDFPKYKINRRGQVRNRSNNNFLKSRVYPEAEENPYIFLFHKAGYRMLVSVRKLVEETFDETVGELVGPGDISCS